MNRAAFCVAALLALALAGSVSAADLHDPNNTFSDLLELVRNTANQWSGRLRGYAVSIFWSLTTIQLVWTFAPLVMKRATGEEMLSEFVFFLVRTIIFFSLLTYSVTWGQAIIDSFRQAGATAAGMPAMLNPGDMFTLAVSLADTVSSVDTWNPGVGLLIMLSAFMILLCFAFIAAFMAVTLIESYIAINAAVFFMGFSGAKITREYAMNWVKYAFSVGAKLFVLTLIVGLIMSVSVDWQASYKHDSASTLTLVGVALLCAILTKTIPEQVQSLITGTSMGGGSMLGGMAAAGMALGAAAAATISTKLAASGIMSGAGGDSGGGLSSVVNSLSGGSSGGGMPSMSGESSTSSGSGGSSFSGSSSPSGGGFAAKAASAAHAASAGAARVVGTMASISVPGMEGVENLSVGPSPVSSAPSASVEAPQEETPENIIRPEGKQ